MKKEQTLTEKIFVLEYLSAAILFGIGIFLVTPDTDPPFIKLIGVGALLLIMLGLLIKIALNHSQNMDERARINWDRSSSVTLRVTLLLLILFGMGAQFIELKGLSFSAAIAFLLSIILCLHAFTFKKIEETGEV